MAHVLTERIPARHVAELRFGLKQFRLIVPVVLLGKRSISVLIVELFSQLENLFCGIRVVEGGHEPQDFLFYLILIQTQSVANSTPSLRLFLVLLPLKHLLLHKALVLYPTLELLLLVLIVVYVESELIPLELVLDVIQETLLFGLVEEVIVILALLLDEEPLYIVVLNLFRTERGRVNHLDVSISVPLSFAQFLELGEVINIVLSCGAYGEDLLGRELGLEFSIDGVVVLLNISYFYLPPLNDIFHLAFFSIIKHQLVVLNPFRNIKGLKY